MEVSLDGVQYKMEWNQGVVLRCNGILAADYADGVWTWVNPNLQLSPRHMNELLPLCAQFRKSMQFAIGTKVWVVGYFYHHGLMEGEVYPGPENRDLIINNSLQSGDLETLEEDNFSDNVFVKVNFVMGDLTYSRNYGFSKARVFESLKEAEVAYVLRS